MANKQSTVCEEIICLLCFEPLKKPKVLDCSHTFCLECLERTALNQNAYLKLEEAQLALGEDKLECPIPTCRQITHLPGDQVRGLPDLDLPATAATVEDLEQQPFCKTHNLQIQFICAPCNTLLCCECKAADHDQHICKEMIVEQPTALSKLVEPALEVISKANSLMEIVATDRDAIADNCTASTDAIRAFFDKLRGLLTHREAALLATVQEYGDKRLLKLKTHRQSLHESRDGIRREVEKMHQENQSVELVTQSILRTQNALVELKSSYSFLSFEEDDNICQELSSLGSLNECYTQPDSAVPIVSPLVVSEYKVQPDIYERSPVPQPYIEPQNVHDIPYYMSHPSRDTCNGRTETLLPVVNIVAPPPESPYTTCKSTHSLSSDESSSDSDPICNSANKHVSWGAAVSLHESSEDLYEAVYGVLQQDPGVNPPPLPPNHPNRHSFNFSSSTVDVNAPRPQPFAEKVSVNRSLTLPLRSTEQPQLPGQDGAEIIIPVTVLSSSELSSASANEIVHPCGVGYIAYHNTLVVTDVHNHCLRLIGSEGRFIEKVGEKGKTDGNFKEPRAIAINSKNEIFVAERGNLRIQKFTATGKFLLKFGQKALARGSPWGIAISSNGSVYVSDWKQGQIHVFQSSGKYVNTIGKHDNFLKRPAGIAFDKQDRLLVVDRGHHCVWILSKDGEVLGQMGSQGRKPGQLRDPYGVTIRDDGSVIVTESGNSRVSIFSSNGRFVRCFGKVGLEPGMFTYPTYVCVNTSGQIIVADEINHHIQTFEV